VKWPRLFDVKNHSEQADTKEKIRLSGEDFAAQNPYYAAIARGYHIAQLTLFSILACFVMLSMLIRSDDITYENFFYLFKDIHAAIDSNEISFDSLVYDADEAQAFETYRGGLAVAGKSGLTIFTATGRQTLSQSLGMISPQLLSSSRCILVYDQGGKEFSLYNSFARIHHGKTSGEYSCAAISDSGWFTLAEQDGNSAVISVYDKHSDLKTEHFKNGYVTSLALNRQGSLLAILMTDAANGSYQTTLSLYRPGTDRLEQEWSFSDFFPLACSFSDNETIFLTGTDRTLVLSREGEIVSDLPISSPILSAFHTDAGFAILCADGTLFIYDAEGMLIGARENAENIRSVLIGEKKVYMLTEYSLMIYDLQTGESSVETYNYPIQTLLWYAEDELLLCSRSTARYLHMAD